MSFSSMATGASSSSDMASSSNQNSILISLPETYAVLEKKVRKELLFRELWAYLIFAVLFLMVVLMQRQVESLYDIRAAIHEATVLEEFPVGSSHIYKNFEKIVSVEELWQWIYGPFLKAIESDLVLDGKTYPNTIYQYNTQIGGLRMRQLRVQDHKCADGMDIITPLCYPMYSDKNLDKSPYGPNNTWKYTSSEDTDDATEWGRFGRGFLYESGGYISDMSKGSNLSAQMQFLDQNCWIDSNTRAIFVQINTYNLNLNFLLITTFLFEFSPAGAIYPSFQFRGTKLDPYINQFDYFRALFEIAFLFLLFYFIYREFQEMAECWSERGSLGHYFSDRWNLLDLLNLFVFLITVIAYFFYLFNDLRENAEVTGAKYIPFVPLGQLYTQIFNICSFNVLLTFFKIGKFLQMHRRLSLLWRTLGNAATDLFYFMIIFIIVFLGYAMMGHMLFGADLVEFRSFWDSIITCFQMAVGVFNYQAMDDANRALAPFFFITFVVLVFYALANMFLAIVNESYSTVNSTTVAKTAVWESLQQFSKGAKHFCFHRCCCCFKLCHPDYSSFGRKLFGRGESIHHQESVSARQDKKAKKIPFRQLFKTIKKMSKSSNKETKMTLEEFRADLGPEAQHYAIRLVELVKRARLKAQRDKMLMHAARSSQFVGNIQTIAEVAENQIQNLETIDPTQIQGRDGKMNSANELLSRTRYILSELSQTESLLQTLSISQGTALPSRTMSSMKTSSSGMGPFGGTFGADLTQSRFTTEPALTLGPTSGMPQSSFQGGTTSYRGSRRKSVSFIPRSNLFQTGSLLDSSGQSSESTGNLGPGAPGTGPGSTLSTLSPLSMSGTSSLLDSSVPRSGPSLSPLLGTGAPSLGTGDNINTRGRSSSTGIPSIGLGLGSPTLSVKRTEPVSDSPSPFLSLEPGSKNITTRPTTGPLSSSFTPSPKLTSLGTLSATTAGTTTSKIQVELDVSHPTTSALTTTSPQPKPSHPLKPILPRLSPVIPSKPRKSLDLLRANLGSVDLSLPKPAPVSHLAVEEEPPRRSSTSIELPPGWVVLFKDGKPVYFNVATSEMSNIHPGEK